MAVRWDASTTRTSLPFKTQSFEIKSHSPEIIKTSFSKPSALSFLPLPSHFSLDSTMFGYTSSVASTRTSASSSSTLFSRISTTSTDDSSTFSAEFDQLAPLPVAPATLPAAQKATSIHLPLRLPSAPVDLADVDLETLSVDDIFEGKPVGFVVAKLRSIGVLQHFPQFRLHLFVDLVKASY